MQVARAKSPSAGGIWQDITGLLFGSQPEYTEDSADALSLFWQSGD